MKLPLFDELKIKNFEVESLCDRFKRSKVGESPYFIEIDHADDSAEIIISNIEKALRTIGVHPSIPYPTVVITKANLNYGGGVQVFKNSEHITKYFNSLKSRRLKGKEIGLLNKVDALVQKIINLDTYKILDNFNQKIGNQRQLTRNIQLVEKIDRAIAQTREEDDEDTYE